MNNFIFNTGSISGNINQYAGKGISEAEDRSVSSDISGGDKTYTYDVAISYWKRRMDGSEYCWKTERKDGSRIA